MMLFRCHVGRSAIEGLGVFASVPINAGSVVWRFDPVFDIMVSKAVLANAPNHVREFYAHYAYEITGYPDSMALDGDDGRFMNHSADPNLDFSTPGVGVAVRDILAGEELTCDYATLASGEYTMLPSRNHV